LAAVLLAASFIIWDISLMSRSARSQLSLKAHVDQLDGLSRLNTAIDELAAVHAEDMSTAERNWPGRLEATRSLSEQELDRMPALPGITTLRTQLMKDLADCDSMHWEARRARSEPHAAA